MDVSKIWQTGLGVGRLRLGPVRAETRQGYILLCVALWSTLAFLVAQHFVVSTVVVQGKSMWPTLRPGDCCFVNCILPHVRGYGRGDIVVIRDASRQEFIVKRIVGLPGDRIELRHGRVFVNGELLPEPYLDAGTQTYAGVRLNHAIRIGNRSYFVMGDNRAESEDSRYFGDVDEHDLVGIIRR
jgi:signal peptidase I